MELDHDGRQVVDGLYGGQFAKVAQRKDDFAQEHVSEDRLVVPDAEDDDRAGRGPVLLGNVRTVTDTPHHHSYHALFANVDSRLRPLPAVPYSDELDQAL